MKLIRPKGIIDKEQQRIFDENRSEIIKALEKAPKGLTRTEIKNRTKKAYATIRKHLKPLKETGQIIERNHTLYLRDYYIEKMGESLEAFTGELQTITEVASKKENVWKWTKKGSYVPSEEVFERGHLLPEDLQDLLEHKERVFGGLRRVFFDLAKVIMKVDVGFIDAEEDLSNVTTQYHNRRAVWSVDASIKPQTHIMLKDGDEWIAVEKEKFNKATRSEKTVNEILEQERKDKRQNKGS